MDYIKLYKLCKAISAHIEMIVQIDNDSPAKAKLKSEIDEDVERLKDELNRAPDNQA